MKYFFLKLIAPRTDFMQTMSTEERALMQEHAAYLRSLMEKGQIAAFGPVAASEGAFGMALATLVGEAEAQLITKNDPTIKSGTGFKYEVFPMPILTVRK